MTNSATIHQPGRVLHAHQLLDARGAPNGVWMGSENEQVTRDSHTDGETDPVVVAWHAEPMGWLKDQFPTEAQVRAAALSAFGYEGGLTSVNESDVLRLSEELQLAHAKAVAALQDPDFRALHAALVAQLKELTETFGVDASLVEGDARAAFKSIKNAWHDIRHRMSELASQTPQKIEGQPERLGMLYVGKDADGFMTYCGWEYDDGRLPTGLGAVMDRGDTVTRVERFQNDGWDFPPRRTHSG